MSKRWDSNDKMTLMKMYSARRSYEDIGKALNRSPNAIKLRLESIVYANLTKGKDVSLIARLLNTDHDTVKQLYYSHKSFLQGKGSSVIDVSFDKKSEKQDNNSNISQRGGSSTSRVDKSKVVSRNSIQSKTDNKEDSSSRYKTDLRKESGSEDKKNRKIYMLEEENHALEEIIKNYKMKRQLRKLYIEGKLDKESAKIYEKILKN